ncbi:hypothetical protein NOF55_23240 [Rhizobiaceae bacterium BDR2-2]|uniref:Uncharacterized protein n=1 Tax=Ectorhizobium quercum TaxID=2965071 RepID=A0AAE3N5E4_9HYPH|nr:hypothetical protein [Ectorhizobium quercum]MCX9000019.1 hypothetical protein [Ectorhizobium quercum]
MSDNLNFMQAIAEGVARSLNAESIEWEEFSVVVEVDDQGYVSGTYGYAYTTAGDPNAIAPDIDDIEDAVRAYWEWLRPSNDKGFIKMPFQANRHTRKVNADFEYENSARWAVTPANVDDITSLLRPNLNV